MEALRRFFRRLGESDEERLAEEVRAWAVTVPDAVPMGDARARRRLKVAGMVRRITIRPVEGFQALEVVLWDGTGEISALWMGRQTIEGLVLGSRLVVEGMVGKDRDTLRIVNPTFEFA